MLPQWLIEKKRDGQSLNDLEIRTFVEGYTSGSIPDYQMAALAMAIIFRGMSTAETVSLTDAMMRSGDCLDISVLDCPTVDKHSTGGIGDKVSLVLAPLVAACGAAVPMLSGRGLGITGGTLDKLESIPGYRTDLSVPEFLSVLKSCGCSITGQTSRLAPADRKLYALRDVTGTVPSIPLISASIMSKKLAEGSANLVLDVKWGRGAFMKSIEEARKLALAMLEIGHRMNRGMAALITDMNQPLGRTSGNALEVLETIETLQGGGPSDLMTLTIRLAVEMLCLSGVSMDEKAAREKLDQALSSGRAFETFRKMVRLQGGDVSVLDHPDRLPAAPMKGELTASGDGWISAVDADTIGRVCLMLGAGRSVVTDPVDARVGVSGMVKVGERVAKGQPLMMLHAGAENPLAEAMLLAREAVVLSDQPVEALSLIVEKVNGKAGSL